MVCSADFAYILKECTSDELYTAIRAVVAGQYYLTPSVLPALIEDYLRLLQAEAKSSASSWTCRPLTAYTSGAGIASKSLPGIPRVRGER